MAFNLPGYNTADIQQIKISDPNGIMTDQGGIGWGGEVFNVWEGVPTVVEGSGFTYIDPMMGAEGQTDYFWGDMNTGISAKYSIAPGDAVVINMAKDLQVTYSGEVIAEDVEFDSIAENNFTGNPFAAEIDIQAIRIADPKGVMSDQGGIGWGGEVFNVWEGVPNVVEGSGFTYIDPMMGSEGQQDYFWGDMNTGVSAKYPIPANQGVVINCAKDLHITIKKPYNLNK